MEEKITRLRTVNGGTISLDATNFFKLKRGHVFVRTVAGSTYHRENIVWGEK